MDELREQLLAEINGPAPEVRTDVTRVQVRGRRHRLMRHAGAVATAVVAVTGVAATALVFHNESTRPVDGADAPKLVLDRPDTTWTQPSLSQPTPYGTWKPGPTAPPPSSRAVLATKLCSPPRPEPADVNSVDLPTDLVRQVTGRMTTLAKPATLAPLTRRVVPGRNGARSEYRYSADVSDKDGAGSIEVSAGRSPASNLVALADEQAFDEGNCEPPKRYVHPNGTVAQVYPVRPFEPFQSLRQTVRVYVEGGLTYQIVVTNYGSRDFRPNTRQPQFPVRVGAGRATLPLTERQLGLMGLALVGA
jgi:hypothetical protein